MANHEQLSKESLNKEQLLLRECTFFSNADRVSVLQQLQTAHAHDVPVTIFAWCCPWMEDIHSLVPYASDIEGTTVSVPTLESKRIKLASKRIQILVDLCDGMNISSQIALCVSNVQPHIYRLQKDNPLSIQKLPVGLQRYVQQAIAAVNMDSSSEEIEENTSRHAQQIQNRFPNNSVNIYNHLEVINQILGDHSEPPQKIHTFLQWVSEQKLSWNWSKEPDKFMKVLYTFDLLYVSRFISAQPFIWVNMQPEESSQTRILSSITKRIGSYPIIKGFQYERNLYE